jgi:guanylate kinase
VATADTTRSPREGEDHGTHYHFVSRAEFSDLVAANAFIEHATFGANAYGTTFAAVASIQDAGKTCVLDIEMEGVKQMHTSHLAARYLFIQPPSMEVLEARLRGRGTDKEEAIAMRLQQAGKELEYAKVEGVHDKVVVNDELEKAWGEVEEFCLAE